MNYAKIFLFLIFNFSLWLLFQGGKLGEKTLRPTTEFVTSYNKLVDLATNPLIEIASILPLDEDRLQVCYTPVADMEESSSTTSVVHAAWTTCWGRVLLYNYLDMVGDRAGYHDTGKTFHWFSDRGAYVQKVDPFQAVFNSLVSRHA